MLLHSLRIAWKEADSRELRAFGEVLRELGAQRFALNVQ
jgi:hypothetical protein